MVASVSSDKSPVHVSKRQRAKTLDSESFSPLAHISTANAHTNSTSESNNTSHSNSNKSNNTNSADFNLGQIAKQLRLAILSSKRAENEEVKAAELKAAQRKKFLKKTEKVWSFFFFLR